MKKSSIDRLLLSAAILARFWHLVALLKALICPLLLYMDILAIEGWYHIRKFIPLDWLVILFAIVVTIFIVIVLFSVFWREQGTNIVFGSVHCDFFIGQN